MVGVVIVMLDWLVWWVSILVLCGFVAFAVDDVCDGVAWLLYAGDLCFGIVGLMFNLFCSFVVVGVFVLCCLVWFFF